ncbi:MAG: 4-(cytidine 5'-diphospho)-2-C-methyl-D-erythritol kinase [Phycisphaerales bacterium JB040]
MKPGDTLHCHAYAKINLALAVGPLDPDAGKHPICSWMHPVSLADRITVTRLKDNQASELVVHMEDGSPASWPSEYDLAHRARSALEFAADRPLPSRIEITKLIPTRAGLGGGSADAAAVLTTLNVLYELGFTDTRLQNIASSLGSDIPFFIDTEQGARDVPAQDEHLEIVHERIEDAVPHVTHPRPAIVSGFGERLERLTPRTLPVSLVLPPYGCSTADVYRAYDKSPHPLKASRVRELASADDLNLALEPERLFNDLSAPARSLEPRLDELFGLLDRQGLGVPHLSGSGSTVFLLGHHAGIELPRGHRAVLANLH